MFVVDLRWLKKLFCGSGTPFTNQSSCSIFNLSNSNFNHKLSNNFNTLSGYNQNVRGLKSKLSTVRINLASLNHYDYFILTEAWLTNDICCNELGMINHSVFRNDQNYLNSDCSKGDDVLIAIQNRFYPNVLTLSNMSFECLAVSFKSNNFKIIIVAIYISPNSSVDVYKCQCAEIENLRVIFSDYTFIIIGDFNLPWLNGLIKNTLYYLVIPLINQRFLLRLLHMNSFFNTNLYAIIEIIY